MDREGRSAADIRRAWLARLGRPIALDFPFFAVDDAFAVGGGRTVALGELGTGRVAAGDALEAVGLGPAPVPVVVARVERPAPDGRGVVPVAAGEAGETLGLTLEHAPGAAVVAGQCVAPPGRLAAAATLDAEVWVLSADDLPGSPVELRRMLADVAQGRGLELFVHTRPVAARAARWRPELGAEYGLTLTLAHPVAVYPGARFALRYAGLTFGVGTVERAP